MNALGFKAYSLMTRGGIAIDHINCERFVRFLESFTAFSLLSGTSAYMAAMPSEIRRPPTVKCEAYNKNAIPTQRHVPVQLAMSLHLGGDARDET
jgi:hypothetical protein